MKGTARFKLLSVILALSYVLSACSGAAVQTDTSPGGGKAQSMEVSFTGTVEAIGSGTMTVSGQTVSIDAKTMLDHNIQVGDIVKVKAQVSESGAVLGLKVETFSADEAANSNTNDGNTNLDNSNSNTSGDNTNANSNTNTNDNGNTTGQAEQEIFGTVEALSADSVTVNGVVYQFASFTELKNAIFVGDEVKLHVIVNADGSFSVREIERSAAGTGGDDDNSNGNDNDDDDDHSNDDDDEDDDDDTSNDNGNGS